MKIAPLYVLARIDDEGNVIGYLKSGGSRAAPVIRTYGSLIRARLAQRSIGGTIMRVTGMEVAE